ncbi:MAG: porin family protein [Alistipes indistinctus]
MKKILFSILAVAAFAFTASAQDTGFGYGVKAGINIANLTNSDGNYKVGFTGGIFADYRFSNLFALSADVLYSRQGAKGDDAKIKTDNLNIPILANFYLVKGLAVKAGVQPGFLLGANDGMKDAFKTFDLAVPVGVSYDFNCGLILDARYNIGVTKVAKAEYSDDSKIRNSVFAVTAG